MISNPVPWPNGARCAVAFTFDMDAESLLHLSYPDKAHTMVSTASQLRYGPQVGVPRILESYRHFGIKQTFFVPGWCAERYPHAVEAMVKDGHEVAGHGWLHEHPNELSDEHERFWLHHSLASVEKITGIKPVGWRAPLYNYSHRSTDLLLEAGIAYDASLMGDDVPYLLRAQRGELLELPTHWGMDDWPPFMHSTEFGFQMPIQAPAFAWQNWWQEFEAAWEYGGMWIPVWHPFLSGRLARWRQTHRMIEQMIDKGGVWFAPLCDIARHVRQCIDEGRWTPRTERYGETEGLPAISGRGVARRSG
ncbi:polysaccharide deacetylase [Verminephrobacter aporrectodeae subsp. tuberculatae]|uniref:polysaccharide deacetylase family protein n=1 Tax=Verminephrobacter aporrectodeae TaxID=1110389 RepID=UPI002238B350|nr:polysaccharide deacetylase [Verminephrobacter aporrectodeae]MCW5222968.1 polysaccharide deacetylase [Verminephrobacter aporrectodeae subsp. tuberculatae]MCW5288432.1 polysaccharide deacetylase [Verminephrobacter aporrectodeae subsp. tuberculatae]